MNFKQYITENIERIDEARNFTVYADENQVLSGSSSRPDVVNHWKAKGHYLVAICAPAVMPGGRFIEHELMSLTPADKVYVQKYKLKPGEYLFRVVAPTVHLLPLVKVNVKIGYIYFLTQRANSGDFDEPEFENRGVKLRWLRHGKLALIRESEEGVQQEPLNELSGGTVNRYFKNAAHDKGIHTFNKTVTDDPAKKEYHERKVLNREVGIKRAIKKMVKH